MASGSISDVPKKILLNRPKYTRRPAPNLDEQQRAVVDHRGGPLLVLAGPGTGKTTTLVEVVVDRIEREELRGDQILVLTFSRKAAVELRDRIAGRMPKTVASTPAMTFHSFCYALVREFSDPEAFAAPPELMSAPAQDAQLATLIAGHQGESWPKSIRQALGTRGFADELHRFMAAAATNGLTPADLAERAAEQDRPEWARVAEAIDEYHQVIDLQNLTDYTDLVTRATAIAADPVHQRTLRDRFALVVVDEYQDTDPLQVQLLHHLAGDGRDLVVVGDHDQAIYGFRGADPTAITTFPEQFATHIGTETVRAKTIALTTTRRFGPRILAAAKVALANPPVPRGLDREANAQHRNLLSEADSPGSVEVSTYVSPTAEAEHIARMLRRAHLDDGLPWSQMAVLVRTAADLTRLQRSLSAAGVPVDVAGDEIPLVAEPAVRSLLLALEAADLISREQPLGDELAEALLTGPLGRLDGPAMRRLGRALRRRDRETSSTKLITAALGDPAALGLHSTDPATVEAVEAARELAALLAKAAAKLRKNSPPEDALWLLWDGSSWPHRLNTQWQGEAESRLAADRDLDAICALFRYAEKLEAHGRRRSVRNFIAELRAQQIPADQVDASAVKADAVALLTAHRSKGLEWPLVVVAGMQDGSWPDLRITGSLLKTEALAGPGATASAGEQLRQERRLFYVACTRATTRLVVTATKSPTDDGPQPSRFVEELLAAGFGPKDAASMPFPRPPRPVSLRGVITELRILGEKTEDEQLRAQVGQLLAEAAQIPTAAARAADPRRWWATAELTQSSQPWRPTDEPVALSGSAVDSITTCALKWFLAREAHGESPSTTAQGFGSIVHAIAADVVDRGVEPDLAEMVTELDEVWHRLDYQAAWLGDREREAAKEALERFARWHQANPREVLAAEHGFDIELVAGGEPVRIRGSMDRIELDLSGRIHVVDLKTTKSAPSVAKVAEHAQLGVYQLAVGNGAAADLGHADTSAGGAELVNLRLPAGAKDPLSPKVVAQPAPPGRDGPAFFALDLVAESARVIRQEDLAASPSEICKFCDFTSVCPTVTGPTIGATK